MKYLLLSLSILFASHAALAGNQVVDRAALQKRFGLADYAPVAAMRNIKIAVLDNGFGGYQSGGAALPSTAELIEGPVNAQAATPHGLGMAQIVWALTGQHPDGPKFYLVNANGFSNFKAAIDFVIEKQVDIVVYSQVWPFGSNFDGEGFINAAVNRATSAGIAWVNAAGNNGSQVHNGRVLDADDRANGKGLRFKNKLDENQVTLTLSWTDFRDDEAYATDKDLDVLVTNAKGDVVGSGELIQRGEAPATGATDSKLSSYPRETVTLSGLDRGEYSIRLRDQSGNFAASDRFRVLLSFDKPGSIEFTDRSTGREIMAPADNASVITVGERAATSAVGPTLDGRRKPDVLIDDANVSFTNGSQTSGSSNAAAIFAGVYAVLKANRADLTAGRVLAYADQLAQAVSNLSDLRPFPPQAIPAWLWSSVPADGTVMQHPNGRFVVVTVQDPLELPAFRAAGAYRKLPDDILVASPTDGRWAGFPASASPRILPPWVEFRQKAAGARAWRTPTLLELKSL